MIKAPELEMISRTVDPAESQPWLAGLQEINRPQPQLPATLTKSHAVKWGGVTHLLPARPSTWGQLQPKLIPHDRAPLPNDLLVGRVVNKGRHGSVELMSGRKAKLYLGDIVVGAFGNRYATRQYEGRVPGKLDYYHMLSQGAVLGQVVSAAHSMSDPTIIEPLGYLSENGRDPLNLTQFGLTEVAVSRRVPTILVLGASMDAGKTTTAAGLIHGLTLAGWRVHAGKLTGTGCAKDILKMQDAGAMRVLDFTHCGYCSTAEASNEALLQISQAMIGHLSQGNPDLLVLEIADGVVQKETVRLVELLVGRQQVDTAILAIHDVLSADLGVRIVEQQLGLPLLGISGTVTRSPLSIAELRSVCSHQILDLPTLESSTVSFVVASHLEVQRAMKQSYDQAWPSLEDDDLREGQRVAH